MSAITIPKKVTNGKELVVIPREEYERFLRIVKMVPEDQLWFWTKEWQKKERQADEDIRRGRVKEFRNVKELIKDLRK